MALKTLKVCEDVHHRLLTRAVEARVGIGELAESVLLAFLNRPPANDSTKHGSSGEPGAKTRARRAASAPEVPTDGASAAGEGEATAEPTPSRA